MRSKYRCLDTEKELKYIWKLKCFFESNKQFVTANVLKKQYFTKYREYQEKRKKLADNYIFKGVS